MNKKEIIKNLQAQNEFSKTELGKLSQELIELKATIDASNAQMQIGGKVSTDLAQEEELSLYNKILKNELPVEMSWMYWQWINQKTIYWLNRYSEFESTKYDKEEILNAVWIDIMYGKSVFSKSKNMAFTLVKIEGNKIWGVPAYKVLNAQNYYTKDNGQWKAKYEEKDLVELDRNDCVIFTWRYGNVGNFVWYLMYGCLYLLNFFMVPSNSSMLVNKMFMEVNDPDNFKNEAGRILNPFKNLIPIVKDRGNKTGSNILGQANHIIETSFNKDSNIEQIITATKFINETLCNEFGIAITSAKDQALSADANLSASTSALIAHEHDRRIIESFKQLGIKLEVYEPDVIEAQNENADKAGQGKNKNTDGDNVNEKAQ